MRTVVERAERFFNDTPIKPVKRETINGVEVRFADGFITPEMYLGCRIKFGFAPDKVTHPLGCFATVWFADLGKISPAGAGYSSDPNQQARLNAVRKMADEALRKEKALVDGAKRR